MRLWGMVLVITLMVADLAIGNGQASTLPDAKPPVPPGPIAVSCLEQP